jgi:ankyrin repeat protein
MIDPNTYTTLYELVKNKKSQDIDELLSIEKINLNQGHVNLKYDEKIDNENMLSLAIKTCDLKVIEVFLKHGANPNYQAVDRHMNKLYCPATNVFTTYMYPERQRKDILELLIQYGLNVNIITSMQDSLLLNCIRMYCYDNIIDYTALDYLLEQGAFINHNSAGESALSIAIEYKNELLINHLLNQGANAKTKHIEYMAKNGNMVAINTLDYYEANREKAKLENSIKKISSSSQKLKI